MQNKARAVGVFGLNLAVEINVIPVVDASGLSLDQIAPHREACLWKIERVFEVLCHVSAPILNRLSVKIARVWVFGPDCQDISTVRKLLVNNSMIPVRKVIF